jgi:hypothetical protein
MAMRNTVIKVETDLAEAFNTAPRQQQEKVKSAMRGLLKLVPSNTEKNAPHLSKREAHLRLKINDGLPLEKRDRMQVLTDKIEYESMTEAEHAELLELTELMEKKWCDQLKAIIELAKLKQISLDEMLKQLGKKPGRY